jgi:hypothetical protein
MPRVRVRYLGHKVSLPRRGTRIGFLRYHFRSAPDQFHLSCELKCHLNLYAFG